MRFYVFGGHGCQIYIPFKETVSRDSIPLKETVSRDSIPLKSFATLSCVVFAKIVDFPFLNCCYVTDPSYLLYNCKIVKKILFLLFV